MNIFSETTTPISRIICIICIVLGVLSTTVYIAEGEDGALHQVQNTFHSVFAPIEYIGDSAGAAIDNAGTSMNDMSADEATLSELRNRVEELTELVTQGEEYRLEAERLEELLNLKDTYSIEGVSGHVIGRSTDAWNQNVTIDVGTEAGVTPGLTVVGTSGVIGQVISAGYGSSLVRLLTDPKSGAAALIQSSRVDGIVRGSLSGVLYLENVDENAIVNVGDVVLTSGLGGSYVKGLLIGTVVRVEGNAKDGTRSIVVSQNEIASSLEEVIVVFSASEAKTSALTNDLNTFGSDAGASDDESDNTPGLEGGV